MKPDSPTFEHVSEEEVGLGGLSALSNLANLGGISLNPTVTVNGDDGSVEPEYDMDDEVMSYMHSHIHNKPERNNDDNNQVKDNNGGVPLSDSTGSLAWDAPLRSAKENALAPDDYNENISGRISRHSEYSIEPDLQTEREDLLEEDTASDLAKRLESELTGSILALWQQRLTQSSSFEGEIEIEYASESEGNSAGPPSPNGDDPSVIAPPVNHVYSSKVIDRNGNRPTMPLAQMTTSSDGTNSALEEIRARLRKTKFDYTSDTKVRISEATPHLDYRSVLKKKGNA